VVSAIAPPVVYSAEEPSIRWQKCAHQLPSIRVVEPGIWERTTIRQLKLGGRCAPAGYPQQHQVAASHVVG
jgi:hypothetical protein